MKLLLLVLWVLLLVLFHNDVIRVRSWIFQADMFIWRGLYNCEDVVTSPEIWVCHPCCTVAVIWKVQVVNFALYFIAWHYNWNGSLWPVPFLSSCLLLCYRVVLKQLAWHFSSAGSARTLPFFPLQSFLPHRHTSLVSSDFQVALTHYSSTDSVISSVFVGCLCTKMLYPNCFTMPDRVLSNVCKQRLLCKSDDE